MRRVLAVAAVLTASACGGSDDGDSSPSEREPTDPPAFVADVRAAIEAVETELGDGQEFFEVTANAQFTNVFVAIDEATAAIPYLFVDGELQPPAPVESGATGNTFRAEDVVFDDRLLVAGVASELPETSIDALSVYGDGIGAIYVLGATSPAGGQLDIVVGPTGAVLSVDPV